ncbi:MAG: gamma-glutamylcyclotransferase family protein [Pseudomonadota bacterium]
MLYFSYGSNMSSRRLQRRVPSATPIAVASLRGHVLKFHKKSEKDGSGKCDAFETHDERDFLYGVVFHLNRAEISALDEVEGVGYGYEKKSVAVRNVNGECRTAFTYYATHIDPALAPLCWYKAHVVRGAEEHGLPPDYISFLKSIRHRDDADQDRVLDELSIYAKF